MRELRWEGCLNVRDLGGLPLEDGGETQYRVLVRADDITRLSPKGLGAMRTYGVSTVVDLRCPTEGACLDGAVRAPVFRYDDADFLRAAHACAGQDEFYVLLLEWSRSLFASVVETLAEAEDAALFHCTAGRDRTGLVAALALSVAGVREDALVEDYVASREALQPRYEALIAAAADDVEREWLARENECAPERLQRALDHLTGEYGGADGYLCRGGADPAALERLRVRLAA
jgi:protein-tyrosine phosphatase